MAFLYMQEDKNAKRQPPLWSQERCIALGDRHGTSERWCGPQPPLQRSEASLARTPCHATQAKSGVNISHAYILCPRDKRNGDDVHRISHEDVCATKRWTSSYLDAKGSAPPCSSPACRVQGGGSDLGYMTYLAACNHLTTKAGIVLMSFLAEDDNCKICSASTCGCNAGQGVTDKMVMLHLTAVCGWGTGIPYVATQLLHHVVQAPPL